MNVVFRLALRYFVQRPARLLLTSLATAAAAAMVVWVVSGYDALLESFDEYAELSLGRYPFSVAPIGHFSQTVPGATPSHAEKFVPGDLIDALRADARVAGADPMWTPQLDVFPYVPQGAEQAAPHHLPHVRVLATDAARPPYPLLRGRWIDADAEQELEAVVSLEGAEGYRVDVGDEVLVGTEVSTRRVRIVGVMDAPRVTGWSAKVAKQQMLTPGVGGLVVSMATGETLSGQPPRFHFVGVSLKDGVDVNRFRFGWSPRLSRTSTPCQFQEAHDIEEALDESASAQNVAEQAHMATFVSMLAALFIIFSTLNMGVTERARQLAVLRAVAFTRLQVGGLIAIEGLLFGTIGFVVGTAAGAGLMWIALSSVPDLIDEGALLGPRSIGLAAASAFGGALLASLVPAYRAMRMRPLDAMTPASQQTTEQPGLRRWLWVPGLLLIGVYPFLSHGVVHGDSAPVGVLMVIGLSCLAGGTVLLAPSVVLVVDRLLSQPVATLLGLPPRLLSTQLGADLGRTTGTALALTVGLGLYVAIHVWGHSLLGGFLPGTWAPDATVGFAPGGISLEQAARVGELRGVTRSEPFVVEQPRLLHDLTRSADRATVTRQDNVIMLGIDPEAALAGPDPLLALELGGTDRAGLIERLNKERACVVPDHFLREAQLQVGDSFEVVPPEDPSHPVTYTIAAAVPLPGWHWQSKPTGFRTRTHRAAALVFASYENVSRDFRFNKASHVWFDFDAERTDAEQLTSELQGLYADVTGREVALEEAFHEAPFIRFFTADTIRGMVTEYARLWLWAMSRMPLVMLLVTMIGVLNALLASVRARRWSMGILRAVGHSRATLVRLVIAEGLLIGACACVLGLSFGVLAGFCGGGMSRYVSFFGGMSQQLIIPWVDLLPGIVATLLLTALAAAWPARRVGRAEPLRLLQAGRSAD